MKNAGIPSLRRSAPGPGPPAIGAPLEAQLLHLGLQLLLSGPAAVQQGQPLLQTLVLPGGQLHLLLCGLPAAPLRSYLAVERLDEALQGGVLLLRVRTLLSPKLLRPESIQVWTAADGTGGGRGEVTQPSV